ncbi:hypothetical protein STEG23_000491, partial [Scotinomys teguina]
GSHKPPHPQGAVGSYWLLDDGEVLFLIGVATRQLPLLNEPQLTTLVIRFNGHDKSWNKPLGIPEVSLLLRSTYYTRKICGLNVK